MSIVEDRAQARRRLGHLHDLQDDLPFFNMRSMLGAAGVFDLLDYGTYQQLNWAAHHLVGSNLFTRYDSTTQIQERELHVALAGDGDERGRVEFEVERTFGYIKYELSVRVRNADANSTHAFFVDGRKLGNITINPDGFGRLEFSTDPSNGERRFPNGVPDIKLGSQIRVGDILDGAVGGRDDSTDGTIHPGEVEFDLFGSTAARGSVQFELDPEDGGLKKEFRVKIDRATPGQKLDIRLGNAKVGQLTVDNDGKAEVKFSTHPNNDEIPFPPNFPEILLGTTVDVGGIMQGAFSRLPDLGPNGQGNICDEHEFQGGLWGTNTTARGGAKFEIGLEDGGFLEHEFRVHVRNGTPGQTHDLRVDGVFVGTMTLNGLGRGRIDMSNRMDDMRELALPDFFPEIHEGSVVEVGNLLTARLRDFGGPCGFMSMSQPHGSLMTKDESAGNIAGNVFAMPF